MNPTSKHHDEAATKRGQLTWNCNCRCSHDATTARRSFARRCGDAAGVALPSVVLVLLPKCPACLAAYIALGTGLGLSFSMATALHWGLLIVCSAALLFFGGRQVWPWLSRRLMRERN